MSLESKFLCIFSLGDKWTVATSIKIPYSSQIFQMPETKQIQVFLSYKKP